jgi:hypothetical protein
VISVHASHRARSGTFSTLSPRPKQAQYPAFSIPGLQFLVLGKSCLTSIFNNGADTEVTFEGGLLFSRHGSCHLFNASSYTLVYDFSTVEELDLPLGSYALYPNELDLHRQDTRSLRFNKSVEVTCEDGYVRRIKACMSQALRIDALNGTTHGVDSFHHVGGSTGPIATLAVPYAQEYNVMIAQLARCLEHPQIGPLVRVARAERERRVGWKHVNLSTCGDFVEAVDPRFPCKRH